MRVKYLAQQHNAVTQAKAGTGTARSGVQRINLLAIVPSKVRKEGWFKFEQIEAAAQPKLMFVNKLDENFSKTYFNEEKRKYKSTVCETLLW